MRSLRPEPSSPSHILPLFLYTAASTAQNREIFAPFVRFNAAVALIVTLSACSVSEILPALGFEKAHQEPFTSHAPSPLGLSAASGFDLDGNTMPAPSEQLGGAGKDTGAEKKIPTTGNAPLRKQEKSSEQKIEPKHAEKKQGDHSPSEHQATAPSSPAATAAQRASESINATVERKVSLFSIRWSLPAAAVAQIKAFVLEYGPSPEQLHYSVRVIPQTLTPDPTSTPAETIFRYAVSLPGDLEQLTIRIAAENVDGVVSQPSAPFTSKRLSTP